MWGAQCLPKAVCYQDLQAQDVAKPASTCFWQCRCQQQQLKTCSSARGSPDCAGTGTGTQAHLSRQRPHDCEGSHVQRHPCAGRQLGLVDLVAAANNIARPTAGLDNDCRQAGCVSRHPDSGLQVPLGDSALAAHAADCLLSESLASARCALGSICAVALADWSHKAVGMCWPRVCGSAWQSRLQQANPCEKAWRS